MEGTKSMKSIARAGSCLILLAAGVVAQAALENLSKIERPPLRLSLESLPMELGGWSGKSEKIDPDILERSQATECLSRTYSSPKYPGVPLTLWINYSLYGTNMRHSPEICLPSHGSKKVESMTKVIGIAGPRGEEVPVSRLAYGEGELVQGVGFWYYIFGEGKIERWVRGLPVTSRSSHGRTTRGSGPDGRGLRARCQGDPEWRGPRANSPRPCSTRLEPILPNDRAPYLDPLIGPPQGHEPYRAPDVFAS